MVDMPWNQTKPNQTSATTFSHLSVLVGCLQQEQFIESGWNNDFGDRAWKNLPVDSTELGAFV